MAQAVADGRVGQWLRTEVNADKNGNLSLRWWRDTDALAETAAATASTALVTNMTPTNARPTGSSPSTRTRRSPNEPTTSLKDRSSVRPVFLHSNRRAAALVAVCSIALLVYGLIETETRHAIAPARNIEGLLPEQRAARPTAENIFRAFAGLGFQRVRTTTGLQAIPDPLTPAQQAIIDALQITSVLPPKG